MKESSPEASKAFDEKVAQIFTAKLLHEADELKKPRIALAVHQLMNPKGGKKP